MRITANQVTLARLLLMPFPCWLLYQGPTAQLWALVLATVIGCTDFVDGYLARKQGPTVLGGLMDPIADKVFIAICYLPALDLGWVPFWLVLLLFVREFLITALRTCFETRKISHRSPYIARYKTWVQMCGVGLILLAYTTGDSVLNFVLGLLAVLALVAFLAVYAVRRKLWFSGAAFTLSFTGFWLIHTFAGKRAMVYVLLYFVVGITWLSASDYLVGFGKMVEQRRLAWSEWTRVLSAILFPIVALVAAAEHTIPLWLAVALISIEMAYGGLDILLAHHGAQESGLAWGARLGFEMATLSVALWQPIPIWWAAITFSVVLVTLARAFVRAAPFYRQPRPVNPAP